METGCWGRWLTDIAERRGKFAAERSNGRLVAWSAGGRLSQKVPAGNALLVGGPAQHGDEEKLKDFDCWPFGRKRESVDVPSPLDTPRRWIVEVIFLAGRQAHAEFLDLLAGRSLRVAYDEVAERLPDDVQAYAVESITEAYSGIDRGTDLDQPVLANMSVVARRGAPPSAAAERSSRVREREPEPESEEFPPGRRPRQDREGQRGSAGL